MWTALSRFSRFACKRADWIKCTTWRNASSRRNPAIDPPPFPRDRQWTRQIKWATVRDLYYMTFSVFAPCYLVYTCYSGWCLLSEDLTESPERQTDKSVTERRTMYGLTTGPGMLPTIADHDTIKMRRYKNKSDVKVNDIISFKLYINGKGAKPKKCGPFSLPSHVNYVKRVIAVGPCSVNGQYVANGCVWVEGDNKELSFDSRHFGPIPIENINAKVVETRTSFE